MLLFLAALFVRIGFSQQVVRLLPTQQELVMDAARYVDWAHEIAAGQWRPKQAFTLAPGYPYLLAVVIRLTQGTAVDALSAIRLLQALAGAVTVLWLAVVTRRLFGDRAGWAAGFLALLYGPATFYTPLLLKTTAHLFFETALLVLLLPPAGRSVSGWRALAAGLCLGAAALLQENLLLLLPVLALFPPLALKGSWYSRRQILQATALVLGTTLAVAPAAWLNFLAEGELVLTSASSGLNFLIGNHRGANGTYVPISARSQHPDQQDQDTLRLAAALASTQAERPISPAELSRSQVSRIFWSEALDQIASAPTSWLRLMLRKARLFWAAYEIPDAEGYDVYRREAGAAWWLPIGFGTIAPLSGLGLLLALRSPFSERRRASASLALAATALFFSVIAFFVFGRYRIVIVPLLLPLAGYGLARLAELARQRPLGKFWLAAAVTLALALVVNLPMYSAAEKGQLEAGIYHNLGAAANRASVEAFLGAVSLTGTEAEAWRRMEYGRALELNAQAQRHLGQALSRDPDAPRPRLELALVRYRQGLVLSAASQYGDAVLAYRQAQAEIEALLATASVDSQSEVRAEAQNLATAVQEAELGAQSRQAQERPELSY